MALATLADHANQLTDRAFDVVMGFGGAWPYGPTPVMVATSRAMPEAPASVSAHGGDIRELCRQAKRLAGAGNVYIDGGGLISQALDADLVDEMILTVAPVLLGRGVPIYRGERLHRFESRYLGALGSKMQVKMTRVL